MSRESAPIRRVDVLVPPLVTFAAVVLLLVVARFYNDLPVQAPPCGFQSAFGIPCVGCGGTRSMQALASGRIGAAVAFNPGVILGILASVIWLFSGFFRFFRGSAPRSPAEANRRIKRVTLIVLALIALNWLYLIWYLK
ncbi:MAG: DUF2752 domain-containing protein [Verrucomicrobiaceae bacterium]|nr:DUF2752 domain-containing protein [Verrucomicrobiaceae bacterium]